MSDIPPTGKRPPCPQAASALSCKDCVEFLLDYLDGQLPAEQRFTFESHIAFCGDCEVFLANYRKAVELTSGCARGGAGAPGKIPEHMVDAIVKALKRPE
ncbi:MAG: zf-HC2 domain-containing protein [Planctomycetota bacterium]|nr:zf-HC2 domain-containing protein [Planctomycetota bacterium]